jgi:hypothetical protein
VRLTLDTNCLIDLEEGRPAAGALRELIELHRQGRIQVFVGAISASENLPGKVAPEHHSSFEERLNRIGITDLPRVLPVGRYGMTFWGSSIWGDENDHRPDQIQNIIHPAVAITAVTPKSRNVLCDIDGLAAHIRAGHDIFVTRDGEFLKERKRKELVDLGAKAILTPDEALEEVLRRLG